MRGFRVEVANLSRRPIKSLCSPDDNGVLGDWTKLIVYSKVLLFLYLYSSLLAAIRLSGIIRNC